MRRQEYYPTILTIILALLIFAYLKKQATLVPVAIILGLMVLLFPAIGKAIHFAWMKLSLALGFVTSRVLLSIIYVFILVPLSVLSKIFRKKNEAPSAENSSYYKKRNQLYTKSDLENLW